MDEVKNWLDMENPDFDQGFALFGKYSRNMSLISYIGRKRHMEMLVYEMKKIAKMKMVKPNPYASKVPVVAPVKKINVIDERKVNREDLPEQMRTLYDSNVEDYKEIRALHEKMKQANSDAGRAEFREKIIKLNLKIKRRWEIIDSGELPVEDKVKSSDINSARAYISKMMKKDELTAAQRELVKEKYDLIVTAGETLKEETLQKLKEKGF